MDIRHYFDNVNFLEYHNSGSFQWKYTLGENIEKSTLSLTPENIHKLDIAIVGIPFDSASTNTNSGSPDIIRKELYQLSKIDGSAEIADFGNLKPAGSLKASIQALRDITDYFNESDIVTVIIGGSQDLTIGICEAFKANPFFSFSCIDASLDLKKGKEKLNSTNFLSYVFSHQPELFQFNLIGYQSYYVAPEYLRKVNGINQHIRLGLLRENISIAEPVFRNSDVISFDIGGIIHSEAPGSYFHSPNGLRSEEACQLAEYAGLSNRLKVFGLFGYNSCNDLNYVTAKLCSQIIWYFIEGLSNRTAELPGARDEFNIYQVEMKSLDKPVVFLKHRLTKRWWMEVPLLNGETKYFGCSEKEYELASNNEIPGIWLKYIQKSDEILK